MKQEKGFNLENEQLTLYLYIQPRASKTEWVGFHGEQIKLRIASPPVDDRANRECAAFLAKALKTPKSNVSIQQGKNNRNKVILVKDYNKDCWEKIINKLNNADYEGSGGTC